MLVTLARLYRVTDSLQSTLTHNSFAVVFDIPGEIVTRDFPGEIAWPQVWWLLRYNLLC